MRRSPVYILEVGTLALALALSTTEAFASPGQNGGASERTGRQVYESTCIACHGPDGKGTANPALAKVVTFPDFTDCSFAPREATADWLAVAHRGGPARGFSPLMPSWSGLFSTGELTGAIDHLRRFCSDNRWPRGELNLPRPLVTGKAFPEDEFVASTSVSTEEVGSVVTKFIYERRIGAVHQVEVSVPLASAEQTPDGWETGVGDIALGYKRTLAHSVTRGNIFSGSLEVKLPAGNESRGLGGGVTVFEPFVTFGQLLPREGFVQAQVGFEIPTKSDHDDEMFWRVAIGQSFRQATFGRTWSPMLEVVAARPFVNDATTEWDLVPQMQVTLSARQHIRVNGGVRLPVNNRDDRSPTVMFYLLWDWFDGGFFQGW
jgi:hypothetical protein